MSINMTMDLEDIDSFISRKKLNRVEEARVLGANGSINEKGLFSFEIFGSFGSPERISTYAYIQLPSKFLHPFAFQLIALYEKKAYKVITGELGFDVKGKKLKFSTEGEFSGILSLYKFWDFYVNSIENTGTKKRLELLKFFKKYSKEKLWQSEWLVLPAGLRDLNTMELENSGVINYDPINDFYIKLINLSNNFVENEGGAEYLKGVDLVTRMIQSESSLKIQNTLLEIHDYFMKGKLSGKDKFLRKNMLKKSVIYSVGDVITMEPQNQESYDSVGSNNIKTGDIGVPVSVLIDTFYPFVVHQLYKLLDIDFSTTTDRIKTIRGFLADYLKSNDRESESYSEKELVEYFLDKCINDKNFLAEVIFDKKETGLDFDIIVMDFLKNEVFFPLLGYLDEEPKKFVTATRYPVNNLKSTQILRPIPFTTPYVETKTLKSKAGNTYRFEITKDPENYSTALVPSVSSLSLWGGDFDG